ncbi:translocation/assembly module TamB domain-containing protein [Aestuariibacter sp. AA17]|uniref:Translocation/assembly module TamB domain-containing protein n=1 Tax=Fluctibacter corallii TaxID=2984329 RepID=A0ABT3A5Z7_9ALTE|nr:translocation/assembly module TamB domain-containing protein [Aestuariibacter sp. AA17]MCV2884111.1 translocation/assembly module TamB domain-containing protein [Aestuariibacter sp. AA17]
MKQWGLAISRVTAKFILIGLLVTVIGTVFLLSPIGSRLIVNSINTYVDGVALTYRDGGFGGKIVFDSVEVTQESLSVSATNVALDLDWGCMFSVAFCTEMLSASSVDVRLQASESDEPPTPPSLGFLTPIPVSLQGISLKEASLSTGSTHIQLSELRTHVKVFRNLTVSQLAARAIAIEQRAVKQSDKKSVNAQILHTLQQYQAFSFTPVSLKQLALPFSITVTQTDIDEISLSSNGQAPTLLSDVRGGVQISSKLLALYDLSVGYAGATLNGKLRVDRVNGVHGRFLFEDIVVSEAPSTIDVSVVGEFDDLRIKGEVRGEIQSQFVMKVDLSDVSLPLDASLSWQQLPEIIALQGYGVKDGEVSLSGNLNDYHLGIKTGIYRHGEPDLVIDVDTNLHKSSASIQHVILTRDTVVSRTSFDASWDSSLIWQGNTRLDASSISVFHPALEGHIQGDASLSGELTPDTVMATLSPLSFSGEWQNKPFTLNGEAEFTTNGIALRDVALKIGQNQATARGNLAYSGQGQIDFVLSMPHLEQVWPELHGDIKGDVLVSKNLQAPAITANLASTQFAYRALNEVGSGGSHELLSLSETSIFAQIDMEKVLESDIKLNVKALDVGIADTFSINLDVSSQDEQFDGSISIASDDLALDLALDGTVDKTRVKGRLKEGQFAVQRYLFTLDQPPIPFSLSTEQLRVNVGQHCWQDASSSLCFEILTQEELVTLDAKLTSLPFVDALNELLEPDTQIQTGAQVNGNIMLSATPNKIHSGRAALSFSPSTWSVVSNPASVEINTFTLEGNIQDNVVSGQSVLMGEQLGRIDNTFSVELHDALAYEVSTKLKGFDLHAFSAVVPEQITVQGMIDANLVINGRGSTSETEAMPPYPDIRGQLSLAQGVFKMPDLPASITDLQYTMAFRGDHAEMSGEFLIADGRGQVNGELSWQEEFKTSLQLKGNQLTFVDPNLYRLTISPDLDLRVDRSGIALTGDLDVVSGNVTVKSLPPQAYSPSKDEVILGQQEKQPDTPIKTLDISLNIDPAQGGNVNVFALGLDADVQGQLDISQQEGEITGNGEVEIVNGRYEAYGQALHINQGRIIFNGLLSAPYFDIEAIRDPEKTDNDVIAGIKVSGSSESPEVSVFSRPDMELPQSLSYLLRGKPLSGQGTTNQDAMLTSMLIGFGLSKSENTLGKIAKGVGIDEFSVDTTGSGEDTKLALTGELADGMQISYGVGVFDSVNEVKLKYQFTPKLYLEAISGANNALDLYYQFTVQGDRGSGGNASANADKDTASSSQ